MDGEQVLQPGTTPGAAERARSLAERGGGASVLPATGSGRATPLLHHVAEGGDAVLLLPEHDPLVATCRTGSRTDLPAMMRSPTRRRSRCASPCAGCCG